MYFVAGYWQHRTNEGQFVLARNDGKYVHVHIFSAHISETCGFIFNKLGI